MAVRVFSYTVTENDIAATSIPQAGVQGEHKATKVEFNIGGSLEEKLLALAGENKAFYYRFDRYDGTGGKSSTEPIEFIPGKDKSFSHLIEQWQTRYSGTIQLYLVITLIDDDKTEMELYSYCVKMMLKALPEAAETDDENYETTVSLAMVAKTHSQRAEAAAKTATEAMERTELAKAALEGGSEWVFDGGDASDSIGVEFVVDSEFINGSENPVKSKVVKEYVDKGNQNLQKQIDSNKEVGENNQKTIEGMADYIVETGTVGEWTYEKWASGKVKCYCITGTMKVWFGEKWGDSVYYANIERKMPDGLFVETPYYANVVTLSGGGILTCSIKWFKDNSIYWYAANHIGKITELNVRFMIKLVGRWK